MINLKGVKFPSWFFTGLKKKMNKKKNLLRFNEVSALEYVQQQN